MFKADIVNRMEACGAMAIVRTESIERGKETVSYTHLTLPTILLV